MAAAASAPSSSARVLLLLARQLMPVRLSFAPPRPVPRGYLLVLTQPHRQCAAANSSATSCSCDGEQHPQAPAVATPGATGPHEDEGQVGEAAHGGEKAAAGAQDGSDGAAAASPAPTQALRTAAAGRKRPPSSSSSTPKGKGKPKGPGAPKQGAGGGGGSIHVVPPSSSPSS